MDSNASDRLPHRIAHGNKARSYGTSHQVTNRRIRRGCGRFASASVAAAHLYVFLCGHLFMCLMSASSPCVVLAHLGGNYSFIYLPGHLELARGLGAVGPVGGGVDGGLQGVYRGSTGANLAGHLELAG
eukprot:816442-Prorocentrum_minimum.AAC.5